MARQIAKKFNSRQEQVLPRLEKLSADDLLDMGEEILDFDSLEATHRWIDQRIARNREAS